MLWFLDIHTKLRWSGTCNLTRSSSYCAFLSLSDNESSNWPILAPTVNSYSASRTTLLGMNSCQICSRQLFPLLSILPLHRSSQINSCDWPPFFHAEYPAVSVTTKLSPDTAVEISSPIPMRAAASTGGSKPRLYCHRSTQYIMHCVGDAIHASEVRIQ
jgi:hypothetical protein